MDSVYVSCPEFENKRFNLRFISIDDCDGLLKVYSDKKAVPLFNSDNCGGDDFHYNTRERMKQAIDYWKFEYDRKGFVRWSIVDKKDNIAIGTIELFHRDSKDYFNNCGLFRLDLRSDYETKVNIIDILKLIIDKTYQLFECNRIATKALPTASERVKALKELDFLPTENKLIGHDGTEYSSYYFKDR
ncbi:GNAT family N-acetyltransferase [Clostridium estertheticum]|uniref:GNAT family N-acetyltransferase n=1 Tax=Clostridium estertheticum TaxID=238834 RepID=A0AA47EMN3_9CLOT|nr:GNAT family N-acetyltransferase [Clostridium estertheticum]MBU3153652.1 GNAT family N-acetyltransferase [Clostridium estertheticum]MBU3199005.1 GNAT family N-acetyltransferase [Clostridium estertheticum]WAG63031.1 GNAT family N-acetyltransferase [Clostridium estertheticum]WAG64313.1 GNAT family N-acetyltransferase [Clostridium estertheticum]